MSVDTDGDRIEGSEAIVESLQRWYHVPALLGVIAYMLWTRTQAYSSFTRDGEVYFSGNDPYYHYRATMYSVENWPSRLYGEPYTQFPNGQNVGHFGTLMDQTVATVALIAGLGDPSPELVAKIAILSPPVFGALTLIPVYYLTKRLCGSRLGGLTAAAILALVPQGAWIGRTNVGYYDHHAAEALTMILAILATTQALIVVQRERPVYEQLVDRDWDGLRPTLKWGGVAGLALAAYILTWPPGIVLAGIFGVFYVLAMSLAVLRQESPEHVAFVGAISHATAAVVLLPFVQTFTFAPQTVSLLQLLLLIGVSAGCIGLATMARYWDRDQLSREGYPIAVGSLIVLAIVVAWLALPDMFRTIWRNIARTMFLGQSDTGLTISEAQSMFADDRPPVGEQFWNQYGFTAFTALGAVLWMAGRALLAKRPREEYLLIVVWTVFVFLMAMTQVRFHYYLVLSVAALNGWLVVQVARLASFPSLTEFEDVQAYHVLTIAAVVMLLVVPMAGPLAIASSADMAEQTGPGTSVIWDENLDWMGGNTPEPGTYGGADDEMDYYGPFDEIEGDYEYPEGAYGVMSWWDYGHWITVQGERIPNANPFQSGARSASAYFQETNETRANMYLEALPADGVAGGELDNMTEAELREAIDSRSQQEASEETRYVMIDDAMASTKFGAITQWAGPGTNEYFDSQRYQLGGENVTVGQTNRQYANTMLSRLYTQDASQLEHYRLVKEVNSYSFVGGSIVSPPPNTRYRSLTRVPLRGGWSNLANLSAAVQQYRIAGQPFQLGDGLLYNGHVESRVKTYERVDGATITGTVEPNETVQATVELEADTGRPFTYTQTATADEDGSFELTVPYATTNELGPEDGYTNASVLATSDYTIRSYDGPTPRANATGVSVPEPAIYEGETIDVELDPVEDGGDGNESTGNGTDGNGTDGGETDGNDSSTGDASGSASSATATASTTSASTLSAVTSQLSAFGSSYVAALRSAFEPIAVERIAG